MDDQLTHPIWKPETGITDLEGDPNELSAPEIPGIKAVWTDQRQRLKGTTQLSTFTEKLSREWAIETGIIENLYDIERGVTQTLIERGFQAEILSHGSTNKPPSYVIQLLKDQKDALDGVFDFVKDRRQLSISYIKELHASLLHSQDSTDGLNAQGRSVKIQLIKGDWKKQANYPMRDGVMYTYCPPEQVSSEMDQLIILHNQHRDKGVSSDVQAAWLHHRFTQIHPFQDGNGRVARAIASLVLVKDGLFPLVVKRDDRASYLDALEAADNGDLKPLIDLIAKLQITQFREATRISEALLIEEDTRSALHSLKTMAQVVACDKYETLRGEVFRLAKTLEKNIESRLNEIVVDIKYSLQEIVKTANACVITSSLENNNYFRSQIIENAKHNIGYFANTSAYRSWIALKMYWSRQSRLVFTIHGIGKPFNGSLICAPFLEFKDIDNEGQRSTLVPIAEEGFIFFYNEDQAKLLARFTMWRENVLKVAIKELTQNL